MAFNSNYTFLAQQVYDPNIYNEGTSYTAPDGSKWAVVQSSEPHSDDYQGALFKSDSGQYVYASRGTESLADVGADLQMGVNKLPDQLVSARNDLVLAKDLITQAGGNPNDLTLVGHSLGGALTQMLAAENPQLSAVTFNAYGAGNLIPAGSYDNITNHVMYLDPVSVAPGSAMPGSTVAYFGKRDAILQGLPDWLRQKLADDVPTAIKLLDQ